MFDEEAREIALDVLHNSAWPDASTRPARLWIEPAGSPLEDPVRAFRPPAAFNRAGFNSQKTGPAETCSCGGILYSRTCVTRTLAGGPSHAC